MAGSQLVWPGVHRGVWQALPRHVCPAGQSTSRAALPTALQSRARVALTHDEELGTHTRARQASSAPQ